MHPDETMNTRWNSCLKIALIGAGCSIAAAIIVGNYDTALARQNADVVVERPATSLSVAPAITPTPEVPLGISPTQGRPGTVVTLIGRGFRAFSPLSELKFGGIDVRPVPVPSADSQGGFSTMVLVPQLNAGSHTITAKVSGTVATATYTVLAAVSQPTPAPLVGPSAPAEAFAALIANNDNLLRVWHFNPASQDVGPDFGWFLYDPRPVFAQANTVTRIAGGRFYWVNVRENQTATICGATRTLFAGWNPVTC